MGANGNGLAQRDKLTPQAQTVKQGMGCPASREGGPVKHMEILSETQASLNGTWGFWAP